VFEKRVLRIIFRTRQMQVRMRDWGKLHNEFHNMKSSPYILTVIRLGRVRLGAGHVALMGEIINAFINLKGKAEGRKSLETPKHI
jgi:hypothetical protein